MRERSDDGSQKYIFQLGDGPCAQAAFFKVLGRARPNIACVSTQLGCAVGCVFCATAIGPLYRNLTAEEICWQVDCIAADQDLQRILDEGFEISFMGMGEPLANLKNVMSAIEAMSRRYPEISRVSISTAGPPHRIDRLTDLMPAAIPVHLQVSLHATTDSKRHALVPRAPGSITNLLRAATAFHDKTGDHVCLNYVLLEGLNDTPSDAMWLSRLDPRTFYVKLSALNHVPNLPAQLKQKSITGTRHFAEMVAEFGLTVVIFKGDGLDVRASCGQLVATPHLTAIKNPRDGSNGW